MWRIVASMDQNRIDLTGFLQGTALAVVIILVIGIVIAMLPTSPLH
jgi:hypothetical protein